MKPDYPKYAFYRFRVGATHHTVDGPELVMDLIDRLAEAYLSRKPTKAKHDSHHYVDVTFTNGTEETIFLVGSPAEFRILQSG